MSPQEEGLLSLVAERIGALDRRIEDVGKGLHERLNRADEHHDKHLNSMSENHEKAERARDEREDRLSTRLTDVERSTAMVKGGIAVIVTLILPFAIVGFDHLLR